ncbi:lysophospholipid acyltransferase family protein [Amphritea atlantica]|uniref:Lysophospholipid acyltransferase family protein n=1 Tax=Amphritea atlantica TaxID=355243 RepID=A0ABY5GTQ6_9GAMM|nr:lysophospholipid acyltransferase family protein [Amphritea atlantica]
MKHLKGWLSVSVLWLLALLPLSLAQKLGVWFAMRAYNKRGKAYQITRMNIDFCFPELTAEDKAELTKASLIETGKMAGELGMSWLWKPERVMAKVTRVCGEEVMEEALRQGRGVIVIGPHLGNWEVLGLYLSTRYTLTSMYRPPKIELMDRLIRKKRARLGAKLAPANVKGVRMAMKSLKAGEVLGILPDQEADSGSGVFVPFFGQEAYTMKLLPQLAAQTGAIVVSAYAKRLPGAEGFEIYFHKTPEQINEKDLLRSATAMNSEVEYCVRQIPEQYQWEYKRFQHRPDGGRMY